MAKQVEKEEKSPPAPQVPPAPPGSSPPDVVAPVVLRLVVQLLGGRPPAILAPHSSCSPCLLRQAVTACPRLLSATGPRLAVSRHPATLLHALLSLVREVELLPGPARVPAACRQGPCLRWEVEGRRGALLLHHVPATLLPSGRGGTVRLHLPLATATLRLAHRTKRQAPAGPCLLSLRFLAVAGRLHCLPLAATPPRRASWCPTLGPAPAPAVAALATFALVRALLLHGRLSTRDLHYLLPSLTPLATSPLFLVEGEAITLQPPTPGFLEALLLLCSNIQGVDEVEGLEESLAATSLQVSGQGVVVRGLVGRLAATPTQGRFLCSLPLGPRTMAVALARRGLRVAEGEQKRLTLHLLPAAGTLKATPTLGRQESGEVVRSLVAEEVHVVEEVEDLDDLILDDEPFLSSNFGEIANIENDDEDEKIDTEDCNNKVFNTVENEDKIPSIEDGHDKVTSMEESVGPINISTSIEQSETGVASIEETALEKTSGPKNMAKDIEPGADHEEKRRKAVARRTRRCPGPVDLKEEEGLKDPKEAGRRQLLEEVRRRLGGWLVLRKEGKVTEGVPDCS